MKALLHTFSLVAVFAAIMLMLTSSADAQRRNDKDIRDSVRSLFSKLDDFESEIRYQMQSSSVDNQTVSEISDDAQTLRDNLFEFQENFDRKRENRDDVNKIVDAARRVEDFLRSKPQNRRVQDSWQGIRAQVERLSANYGVTPKWTAVDNETPQYPRDYPPYPTPVQNNVQTVGLSGTYTIDRTRSESVDDIVTNTSVSGQQREDLKDKLEAPEQIVIDLRGNQVTLSTSNASPVTFTADGRDKTEKTSNGKTLRVRATLSGQSLTVSSLGGETDYTITFTSVSNGKGLKVSRRITTDYMNQTVFAESVYNKTDSSAQLGPQTSTPADNSGGYSDNDNTPTVANGGNPNSGTYNRGNPNRGNQNRGIPTATQVRPGNYVVPNGTIVTGILENEVNAGVSQNNDRFRMTVQSPDEFRGATIEGYISGVTRSGKVSGQSTITFNFEKITLRNGQTYDFAGYLQAVADQNGKVITIDNEGTARGDSQTRETAKRGGIGAGLGAIIGAIAGGGKGAAIGAVIGGGAGAGSVVVQGKNDIRLMPGSTITVQSASPNQQYPR